MVDASEQIRLAKCWHGSDQTVVFQAQPARKNSGLPKRFYFIADPNQANRGFRFTTKKPQNLKVAGMAANMVRKHLPSCRLVAVREIEDNREFWAFLIGAGGVTWRLHIDKGSPPALGFVNPDGEVLFTIGKRGAFTKKHSFEGTLPAMDDGLSLTKDLLSPLMEQAADGAKAAEAAEAAESARSNEASEALEAGLEAALLTTDGPGDVGGETERAKGDANDGALPRYQTEARQRLNRRLRTARKSLDKHSRKLPSEEAVARAQNDSQLLKTFAYLVKPGATALVLKADETGLDQDQTIELPDEGSPGRMIEVAFAKAKKMGKQRSLGLEYSAKSEGGIAALESDIQRLQGEMLSLADVQGILRRHKLAVDKQPIQGRDSGRGERVATPHKTFWAEDGSEIRVGKGPKDNDVLTKTAKSNDYWFHCVGVTGSHVILPYRSLAKKSLSPTTMREAAILAVHYSKVREDRAADVYVARKQNIRKQKGMPPGLWLVDRADTIYVKYEESELKTILDRMAK